MPMPLCYEALIIGCILTWVKDYAKTGKIIITTGVLFLIALSTTTVSNWLIKPLEYTYTAVNFNSAGDAPPELNKCKYIVILGSSNSEDLDRSALSRLSSSGLARLTEGLRLARALPHAKIIVSGPAFSNYPSHASVLISAAKELIISDERFIKIESAKDTEDESYEVKKIVGTERIALVTSAWHMPRAMYLFEHQGIQALACPTDYSVHIYSNTKEVDFSQINSSLWRSTWAIHERLGLLWLKFKYSIASKK